MIKRRRTFIQRARARMISGFLLIVPTAVTIFVARFVYNLLKEISRPVTTYLYKTPFLRELMSHDVDPIPGARVVITILITLSVLYLCGFISTTYVTRKVYEGGERLLLRIPFLNDVYVLTKQVIDMITNKQKLGFKQIGLFEYPRPGAYALGFVTGETSLSSEPGRRFVTVLMPLAPIPTQLFLMVVPASDVRIVDIPVDQAVKVLMSGGTLVPGELKLTPYER